MYVVFRVVSYNRVGAGLLGGPWSDGAVSTSGQSLPGRYLELIAG